MHWFILGAVFQPKGAQSSPAELELRAARTLSQLQTLLPNFISRWAGPAYQAGLLTLFSALQSPALNKQVLINFCIIKLKNMTKSAIQYGQLLIDRENVIMIAPKNFLNH